MGLLYLGFIHTYSMEVISTVLIACRLHSFSLFTPRNFRGDRIKWNFLGQTSASRFEGFPTFQELRHLQGVMVLFLVLSYHQHALKKGTDLVLESFENLHILMRLSARKNFIDFSLFLHHSHWLSFSSFVPFFLLLFFFCITTLHSLFLHLFILTLFLFSHSFLYYLLFLCFLMSNSFCT